MTRALLLVLASRRRQRKDEWERGEVLSLLKDQQMLLNAASIGECQAFKFVQELDLEKLNQEIEDVRETSDEL